MGNAVSLNWLAPVITLEEIVSFLFVFYISSISPIPPPPMSSVMPPSHYRELLVFHGTGRALAKEIVFG